MDEIKHYSMCPLCEILYDTDIEVKECLEKHKLGKITDIHLIVDSFDYYPRTEDIELTDAERNRILTALKLKSIQMEVLINEKEIIVTEINYRKVRVILDEELYDYEKEEVTK